MAKEQTFTVSKSDEEWRKELNADAYRVLRQHGTEPAFNNEFNAHKGKGVYACGGCSAPLFKSEAKYESGSGWPSFFEAIDAKAIGVDVDKRHGMVRQEIHCSRCGGHIGHVFTDGPQPTGLRYCTNSAALKFCADSESE